MKARALRWRDRREALALLARAPLEHLYLLDLVDHLGRPPAPGEARAELLGVWEEGKLLGVASLRPSVALALAPDAIPALMPFVEGLGLGLVKSEIRLVSRLWQGLVAAGRRALVDRTETAHVLEPGRAVPFAPPAGARLRAAAASDLPDLVEAARASLLEEKRPDPFDGDAEGFRRWVRGRLDKALVVEIEGHVRFVAYADVRRPEGYLLQGVYTWPGWRRRGLATAGVSAVCGLAFVRGTAHVQLAVVDGNVAGERLYARLGFRPFAKLRTILFTT